MSWDEVTPEIRQSLEARAFAGAKAKNFKFSEWYQWLNDVILGSLEDQAMHTLRTATDDTKRIEAQQMSLASHKVRSMIENLISQGDDAKEELLRNSNPKEGENA